MTPDDLPNDASVLSVLKMTPALKIKPWGGRRLQDDLNKTLPPDGMPYGESWEVADLEQGHSQVACGAWSGHTLGAVMRAWGARLCGPHVREAFPLLVKFLDACEDLSVQVHPGHAHANPSGGIASKDESWIILKDGGAVYHGFIDDEMTPARFTKALEAGECMTLLRRHDVAAGDVIRVPPGTVHAIGAGVLLLEIQQPSDTTYRLWDHGRVGLDGAPRPLHIDQGIEVVAFGKQPPLTCTPHHLSSQPGLEREVVVSVDAYHIERWTLSTEAPLHPKGTAQVLVCIEGSVHLTWGSYSVRVDQGESAIVPVALEGLMICGRATCIVAC